MQFVSQCTICDENFDDKERNSILLHCECVVSICASCAKVEYFFNLDKNCQAFITCPICCERTTITSGFISGIEESKKEKFLILNVSAEVKNTRSRKKNHVETVTKYKEKMGLKIICDKLFPSNMINDSKLTDLLMIRIACVEDFYNRCNNKNIRVSLRQILTEYGPLKKIKFSTNFILNSLFKNLSCLKNFNRKFELL
jgi:hypothetical protein